MTSCPPVHRCSAFQKVHKRCARCGNHHTHVRFPRHARDTIREIDDDEREKRWCLQDNVIHSTQLKKVSQDHGTTRHPRVPKNWQCTRVPKPNIQITVNTLLASPIQYTLRPYRTTDYSIVHRPMIHMEAERGTSGGATHPCKQDSFGGPPSEPPIIGDEDFSDALEKFILLELTLRDTFEQSTAEKICNRGTTRCCKTQQR